MPTATATTPAEDTAIKERVLVAKKKEIDMDAMAYAQKKLDEEYLEMVKRKKILQTELDKLEGDTDKLRTAFEAASADVKQVNEDKKKAMKGKLDTLADVEKKISDQSNTLKSDKDAGDKAVTKARQEEKKAYEKVKDIEKTLTDVAATRLKVKTADKKLKVELRDSQGRSAELKIAEDIVNKRETKVTTNETDAINALAKVKVREDVVKEREDAVKVMAKEVSENVTSVNTQLKGLEGFKAKVQKEIERAKSYYTLIDEARREITKECYTEDDIAYVNLSTEQAKKVDTVASEYLKVLEAAYKKKDS